jgi:hypothetical protein
MKAEAPRGGGGGVRKDEAVRATVEAAAERRWLPACLRWGVGDAAPEPPEPGAEPPAEAQVADDAEAEAPAEPLAA